MYSLRSLAKLPSQKILLTVSSNKKQSIDYILADLTYRQDIMLNGYIVITGNDPVPIQINQGHHHSCPSTSRMSVKSAISHCQVLCRAGSVHHGADQYMLHDLPDAIVTVSGSFE